jgi:hypothetical protein
MEVLFLYSSLVFGGHTSFCFYSIFQTGSHAFAWVGLGL